MTVDLNTLLAMVSGPVPREAFGLPSPFRVTRREAPEINAMIHNISVNSEISVAITDEAFMSDVQGDYVVPVIRQAALELAIIIRDQMDLYIREVRDETSTNPH